MSALYKNYTSIKMGLEEQAAKPSGFNGRIFGKLMNQFHTGTYKRYLIENLPDDDSVILDIGCGGGKLINYLSDTNKSYILHGIDHSAEMVKLSKKVNRKAINTNQVEILEDSVIELPFKDDVFDLVTAFETIQFWPDTDKAFSEVVRVLKKNGSFLIFNRYPREGTKWWKLAKIKNENEYIDKLKKAGFDNVNIDRAFKKGWIILNAKFNS